MNTEKPMRVPQPIDQPAGDQKPDRVRELEREDDVAVVDFRPAELLLQRRLEDPDDLAIDVVDRRREEQQRADHPADVARSATRCRRPVMECARAAPASNQIVGLRR